MPYFMLCLHFPIDPSFSVFFDLSFEIIIKFMAHLHVIQSHLRSLSSFHYKGHLLQIRFILGGRGCFWMNSPFREHSSFHSS